MVYNVFLVGSTLLCIGIGSIVGWFQRCIRNKCAWYAFMSVSGYSMDLGLLSQHIEYYVFGLYERRVVVGD